ncbi:MAG: hypothetical protein Q4D19_01540 [Lautropia sp.]|nr:hypothetical protein [Lautropia sp.]
MQTTGTVVFLVAAPFILSACATPHALDDDIEQVRQRQRAAVEAARKQEAKAPPPVARCNFVPAHATSRGEGVPPSYECSGLSKKQYQSGKCREVPAYTSENGTFISSYTRCLANPLDAAFEVIGVPPAAVLPNTSHPAASVPAGAPSAPRPWGELMLPTDDGSGIDQGNDTYVKPVTGPGALGGS